MIYFMTTLKERLLEAMQDANLNKTDLWKGCGLSSGAITHWFNGETHTLKGENLLKASKILSVNPNWLATGLGKKEIQSNNNNAQSSDDFTIREYIDVRGAMGTGILLRDQPGQITGFKVNAEWINKNVPANSGKENLAVVTGFGDSMRGMFNSGDPLLIDTGVRSLDFDGVYFFRVGNEGFIKRLQRIPGDGIRAISTNKEYESWTITKDMDFEVFGRVLKVWNSEDF